MTNFDLLPTWKMRLSRPCYIGPVDVSLLAVTSLWYGREASLPRVVSVLDRMFPAFDLFVLKSPLHGYGQGEIAWLDGYRDPEGTPIGRLWPILRFDLMGKEATP